MYIKVSKETLDVPTNTNMFVEIEDKEEKTNRKGNLYYKYLHPDDNSKDGYAIVKAVYSRRILTKKFNIEVIKCEPKQTIYGFNIK